MPNIIDKKYKSPKIDLTNSDIKIADYMLEGYIGNNFYAYNSSVLEYWNILLSLHPLDRDTDAYRGMSYRDLEYNQFLTLLQNVYSKKSITTKKVRSWSFDRKVAYDFATEYYHGLHKLSVIKAGLIISASIKKNEAIVPDNNNDEKEIITPPGTYQTEIYFIWVKLKTGGYYYMHPEFNNPNYITYLEFRLNHYSDNGPKLVRMKSVSEFIRIARSV